MKMEKYWSLKKRTCILAGLKFQKRLLRIFRESATVTKASGLSEHKDSKTFLIRHLPKLPFDNSCFVEFGGNEYQIIAIERDYSNKEIDLIKGVMVS